MMWVFIFVVSCITTFLMVMYNAKKEELKKCILCDSVRPEVLPFETRDSVDNTLKSLTKELTEKEFQLQESRSRIQNAQKALNNVDDKNSLICDHYQTLMTDLKNDLVETESEYNKLATRVATISKRREDLKNDVLAQQKTLVNFSKHLEDREGNNHVKMRGSGKIFGSTAAMRAQRANITV